MVSRLLERSGYRVSGYIDQRVALAALRADPASFDLVVTDYNMPVMSGLDVAREVKSIRADLPISRGYLAVYANDLVPGAKTLVYHAPNGKVSKIIGVGETRGGLIVNYIVVLRIKYDCRANCQTERGGVALVSLEEWGISQMF